MPKLSPDEKGGTIMVMAELAGILFILIFWQTGTFVMLEVVFGIEEETRSVLASARIVLLVALGLDLIRRLLRGDWKTGVG